MSVEKSRKTVSMCMRWHEETTLQMELRERQSERKKENEKKHAHEFETERIVVAVLYNFPAASAQRR